MFAKSWRPSKGSTHPRTVFNFDDDVRERIPLRTPSAPRHSPMSLVIWPNRVHGRYACPEPVPAGPTRTYDSQHPAVQIDGKMRVRDGVFFRQLRKAERGRWRHHAGYAAAEWPRVTSAFRAPPTTPRLARPSASR